MKNFTILAGSLFCVLTSINALAATNGVYVCSSKDFNRANTAGQSLKLSFNEGILVRAEKMPGSWFGEKGVVENPKVVSATDAAKVYAVDFRNDELHGRIVVKSAGGITYTFGYSTDERNETSTNELTRCKAVSQ